MKIVLISILGLIIWVFGLLACLNILMPLKESEKPKIILQGSNDGVNWVIIDTANVKTYKLSKDHVLIYLGK